MNIIIRQETTTDYFEVENIAREAFWNLYIPGACEHYTVYKIRQSADFIKELSFVIEVDNKIVGAIFYTHSQIIQNNQIVCPTISFGPVFIHPDYHRQGLGRKLIQYSIIKAKQRGYRAIVTLGYPYHYAPYGFINGKHYHISMPDGKYYLGLLVLELYHNALAGVSGYAHFSKALDTEQTIVEEFDKKFLTKVKKIEPSQIQFELACTTIYE